MKKPQPSRAKGGFGDNPQNINLKGRPKKGYSITEWFRGMLNSNPEVKDAIGRAIMAKAISGDSAAQKLVWQYMDGMPLQNTKQEITGKDGESLLPALVSFVNEDNKDKHTD